MATWEPCLPVFHENFLLAEALVRVRAQIPTQLHLYHQILVQQESLEGGRKEISNWLDQADQLLAISQPTGSREQVQAQLDRHKVKYQHVFEL